MLGLDGDETWTEHHMIDVAMADERAVYHGDRRRTGKHPRHPVLGANTSCRLQILDVKPPHPETREKTDRNADNEHRHEKGRLVGEPQEYERTDDRATTLSETHQRATSQTTGMDRRSAKNKHTLDSAARCANGNPGWANRPKAQLLRRLGPRSQTVGDREVALALVTLNVPRLNIATLKNLSKSPLKEFRNKDRYTRSGS